MLAALQQSMTTNVLSRRIPASPQSFFVPINIAGQRTPHVSLVPHGAPSWVGMDERLY
jgi:hypothetical protein